jgi:hypothetical protein
MIRRFSDSIILGLLVILPMMGVFQACGSDGIVAPDAQGGTPSTPPLDNHAPVAVFSVVSPEEGVTPLTVMLDASMSFDPDGDPIEFTWLFSDGENGAGPVIDHVFESSGRHNVRLVVTDQWGLADDAGPATILCYGLANSAWPKFAHDERNSGLADFPGPMMDLANADSGHAFPRYWRGGIDNGEVKAICISYDGTVIYTQSTFLRARTPYGDMLWDTDLGADITLWPAVAYDGTIITGTDSGKVFKVSQDGQIVWTLDLSQLAGKFVRLNSAVNIDAARNIYLAGVISDSIDAYSYDAALFSISFDGDLLWYQGIEPVIDGSNPYKRPLIPVITAEGNILINGGTGYLFSPDGELIRTVDFMLGEDIGIAPLGPPSIGENGMMTFAQGRSPLFYPDGSLFLQLTGDMIKWSNPGIGTSGLQQAPAWGHGQVAQLLYPDAPTGLHLVLTSEGGFRQVIKLQSHVEEGYDPKLAGVTIDSIGRLYVSSYGIRAFSPISISSVFPFVPRRFSLWSYEHRSSYITPPVIGDDRWLYIGYGTDIMALGD